MKLINLLGIGLTGLGAVALAFSMDKPAQTNVTAQTYNQVQEVPSQPPRHKITVTLTSPEDLKVKEGQRIKQGDDFVGECATRHIT